MFESVGIVGVGLIGASIGLALKRRQLCRRVLGIGRRADSLETAKGIGAIDEVAIAIDESLAEIELVIVCTPVDRIVERALEAAAHLPPTALMTDAGSTKARIVAELSGRLARGPVFLGSHPLAGSHQRGPEAADASLFEGRVCVVTPLESTPADALARIEEFWRSLGMTVVRKDPAEHDRIVARTSHLPHVVAATLAGLLTESDIELTSTGFADTTRIAAGDPSLWAAIFEQNQAALLENIDELRERLDRFRAAVARNDREAILEFLEYGKKRRDALGS